MNYRTTSSRSAVTDLTGGNTASGGNASAITPSSDGNTAAPSQVTSLVPQATSSGPGNMASIGPTSTDAARSGQAPLGPVQLVSPGSRPRSSASSLDKPSIQAALPVSSGRRDSVSRPPSGTHGLVDLAVAPGLRRPIIPTLPALRPVFQVQAESPRYIPDQPPATPWVPLGVGLIALLAVGYALTR